MRGFLPLGGIAMLAAFSPPDSLPPRGIQEGPPKSWIPDRAPQPPFKVTPNLPKPSPPDDRNDAASIPPDRSDAEYCAARKRGAGYPSEAFVNAYSEGKTAIAAGDYEKGLRLAREAENLGASLQMKSASLSMQLLAAAGLGDAAQVEDTIARRVAVGCITDADQEAFEQARKTIEQKKQPEQ